MIRLCGMAKKKGTGSKEIVIKTLLSMNELMSDLATKNDLEKFATKDDLEKVKNEILKEIRPISKAVDKDAVTIINHESRLARLEQR